jgi:hypothetical protein
MNECGNDFLVDIPIASDHSCLGGMIGKSK